MKDLDFGQYMRIQNALKIKIPNDAREKEEFRLDLIDLCISLGIDVKQTDVITFLKNKLKTFTK